MKNNPQFGDARPATMVVIENDTLNTILTHSS